MLISPLISNVSRNMIYKKNSPSLYLLDDIDMVWYCNAFVWDRTLKT